MSLSIVLKNADRLPQIINEQISSEMNKRVRKNKNKVSRDFKFLIRGWIESSPEIQSLLSQGTPGSLNAAFGLSPGSPNMAVESIVNAITNSIVVSFSNIDRNLNGSATFNFLSKTFVSLLGLPDGHQKTEAGTDLHWLDWLLTKGDTTIVQGFFYKPSGKGRSGGGTMQFGGAFRVPAQFSGTVENNFVTRAFQGKDKEISAALRGLLV